jgi:ABC-2 type transport system ATP-binding protein
MNGNAIEVLGLQKTFGTNGSALRAVDGVSFTVQAGEIFSLLGPNGAGKTTSLSMLSCLLQPDSGDALVFGRSIRHESMAVKSVLGVVPQDIALYEDLSARENLTFWGHMYGLEGKQLRQRVDAVLEMIGLADRQKERVGKYSGGMKRRVNIGVALLHQPRVIYMDEPTVGIDPQSRRRILDSVVALKQQGMTILYTTHYMEEAQELSDHIAIMDHGKIIACGSYGELIEEMGRLDRIRVTINADPDRVMNAWKAAPGVKQVMVQDEVAQDGTAPNGKAADNTLTLLVEDSNRVLPHLFEASVAANVRVTSVDIQAPNLEAVFLHLTGRALRD